MEVIEGYIEHIVFHNEDNGYTVMNLASGPDEVICVGTMRYINEGEMVELTGDFTEHQMYGEQFVFTGYEYKVPDDEVSMIRYLSSGAIKGIGQALAKRIVDKFGDDTFRIIEETPDRLSEVKGISDNKAREIAIQFMEKQELRQVMVFLQQYGITNQLSIKIFKEYGLDTYNIMRTNPYKMAEDIDGVGFKTADEIASKIGIRTDSDYRIRSGVIYLLTQAAADGHCYLPKEILISKAQELLQVPEETIWIQITNLMMDRKLYIKEQQGLTAVYGKNYYHMEVQCARMLKELNIGMTNVDDHLVLDKKLMSLQNKNSIQLEEMQLIAVRKAIENGITIITGGPGTGKTTIINMIIGYFEEEGMDIVLAAPTGRAAKRMSEATGYEAFTIQRLLHLRPSEDGVRSGFFFEKNEDEPLETDVIIIDEMSMVDLPLFNALLKAVMIGTRLIFVGDINQLPSVGPGAVLKDIINSGAIDTIRLNKIFRQAEQSDIIVNAHKINAGEMIKLDTKSKDFLFLEREDVSKIINHMILLVRDKLPGYVGAKSTDIQILTPMRKGPLGVENLNPVLQKYLNPEEPGKDEKQHGNTLFRVGDKVMQIKNNYQLEWEIRSKYGVPLDKGQGIFNGDMGVVKSINEYLETLTVEYDGARMVDYQFNQLDEIELSYAVTIHKSQGSEYPAVVIPLLSGPRMLLNRNLLYTGVTRARSCVMILGSKNTVMQMIENGDEHKRYTALDERIKEAE